MCAIDTEKLAKCHFARFDDEIESLAAQICEIADDDDKQEHKLVLLNVLLDKMFSQTGLTNHEIFQAQRTTVPHFSRRSKSKSFIFASIPVSGDVWQLPGTDSDWCRLASVYHDTFSQLSTSNTTNDTLVFLSPAEDDVLSGLLTEIGFTRFSGADTDPLSDSGVRWDVSDNLEFVVAVDKSDKIMHVKLNEAARETAIMHFIGSDITAEMMDTYSCGLADGMLAKKYSEEARNRFPNRGTILQARVDGADYEDKEEIEQAQWEVLSYSSIWISTLREKAGIRIRRHGNGPTEAGKELLNQISELYGIREDVFAAAEKGYDEDSEQVRSEFYGPYLIDMDVLEACQNMEKSGVSIFRGCCAYRFRTPSYSNYHSTPLQLAIYAGALREYLELDRPLRFAFVENQDNRKRHLWGEAATLFATPWDIMFVAKADGECQKACRRFGYDFLGNDPESVFPMSYSDEDGSRLTVLDDGALSPIGLSILRRDIISDLMQCELELLCPDNTPSPGAFISDDVFLGYLKSPEGAWEEKTNKTVLLSHPPIYCPQLESDIHREYGGFYQKAAEIVGLWNCGFSQIGFQVSGLSSGFTPQHALELARILGVDNMIASWAAGVPYSDIVS